MSADALAEFLRALSWDGALVFECASQPSARVDVAGAQLALELALLDADRGDGVDADPANAAALTRIQAKVDLILRLLAHTLQREALQVSPRQVRFNEYGMAWDGAAQMTSGGVVELALGLENSTVLRLPARVTVVSTTAAPRVVALFDGLPESLRELLRRYVFKAHRRQRAQAQKVMPMRGM